LVVTAADFWWYGNGLSFNLDVVVHSSAICLVVDPSDLLVTAIGSGVAATLGSCAANSIDLLGNKS